MKIAPSQRQHLDLLRDTLMCLDEPTSAGAGFRRLQARLDDWSARIAVIGQVKAGKSTFVNAFLGQPDLLPSDVNPWTSVVTNLHLNRPGLPASGARFDFFSQADWAEIMDGNSRLRKLAEQMLPGFDVALLQRQSLQMQARARARLGPRYGELLGQSHSYDFVSTRLLESYVCAGTEGLDDPAPDATPDGAALGRYSLLTRMAQVYLRHGDFLVPAVLTDTPGVNDPFLVRDEITCRSLDHSDIFIVVLSAHQPLTEVDIALMRILAQQEEKDVMIFINRIDELEEPARAVPAVIEDVIARLSQAIPGVDFTIMPGSAHLADLALREGPEAEAQRRAADTPALAQYLQTIYGLVPETARDRLYLASGMEALKFMLSGVLDRGVGGKQLLQIRQDIRAEIGGQHYALERERHSLRMQIEQIGRHQGPDALQAITAELAELEGLHAGLTAQFQAATGQIERILTRAWGGLEKALNGVVEAFLADQRNHMASRLRRESAMRRAAPSLGVDFTLLHQALNSETRDRFMKSRAGTDVVLANCLSACLQIIGPRFEALAGMVTFDDLPFDEFASTLVLSKRRLDLDLVFDRAWAFWQRPKLNIPRTLEALRLMAAAELRPAIEKLLKAFSEAQAERAMAGTERIRVLLRTIEASISERRHRLLRDRRLLETTDPRTARQMAERLQSRLEVIERRLQNLSVADSALARPKLAQAA